MENEETNPKSVNAQMEEYFERIIKSERISSEDVLWLSNYGITSGLIFLGEILKTIEEQDLRSASKIYHLKFLETVYLNIRSEFKFRTAHFFQNGIGAMIPVELTNAFLNLFEAFGRLEIEMSFELDELDKSINQRELVYLFLALAEKNYIRSNTTLLAEAINLVTGYSEGSIERVIQNFNNTNGGLPENEKRNLLKKIKDAIDSF